MAILPILHTKYRKVKGEKNHNTYIYTSSFCWAWLDAEWHAATRVSQSYICRGLGASQSGSQDDPSLTLGGGQPVHLH